MEINSGEDQFSGILTETVKQSENPQKREWVELNCPRGHHLGYTNHKAIIFGGTYIQQPSVPLFCNQCKQTKRYYLQTDKKIIRFVTESETVEIINMG